MLRLSAKIRKESGRKTEILKRKGVIPAILYGPKIKPVRLEIDLKEFEKIYREAGESSMMQLKVANGKSKTEEFLILIKETAKHPLTGKFIHVDFYQPSLEKEITAKISIILQGESPAVKDLGGTLIKNISEVEIKALPQNLPHELKANIAELKTFEDKLLIKNLETPENVKILKSPEEIVAWVSQAEKVEEELEKPLEEKVEEIEKVEKPKKEVVAEDTGEKTESKPETKPK